MSKLILSDKQRSLFSLLPDQGTLVFAAGPKGISANIVGPFSLSFVNNEDLLSMGDGTNHIHIDWSRIKRAEIGSFHGEGMLTIYDGDEALFRLYRVSGPYSKEINESVGDLL